MRFSLTPQGIDAAEDEELLDQLLPIAPRMKAPQPMGAETATVVAEVRRHVTDWLSDEALRAIVMRDLGELEGALTHGLDKCVALLAGSLTEALLVDVLDRRPDLAAPYFKKKKFPDDASLDALVTAAIQLGLLKPLANSAVVGLTDYRDLIHPDRERRLKVRLDATTTRLLTALLGLVARELDDAHKDGRLQAYVDT